MKKLFVILTLIFVASCSSTTNKQKPAYPSRTLDQANRLACIYKNGTDNQKYCQCFVDVLSEVTTGEVKKLAMSGDPSYGIELAKLMFKHRERLNQCEKHKNVDISIKPVTLSPIAKKVLKDNATNLLAPQNRVTISPNLKIGYEYRIDDVSKGRTPFFQYKLTKIDDGNFYFSTVKNGKVAKLNSHKFSLGVSSYLNKNGQYITNSKEQCRFKLGECHYNTASGKPQKMLTEFRDGYWISNQPGFRGKRVTVIYIYGLDGLPLYESTTLESGFTLQYERVEL